MLFVIMLTSTIGFSDFSEPELNIGSHGTVWAGPEANRGAEAWIDAMELSRFQRAFRSKKLAEERTAYAGKFPQMDSKKLVIIAGRQRNELAREPERRGKLIRLAKGTDARVIAIVQVIPNIKDPDEATDNVEAEDKFDEATEEHFEPDSLLVEILGGASKGKLLFIEKFRFQVSSDDSDEVKAVPESSTAAAKVDDRATPEKPSAELLIVDTAWETKVGFVETHTRIRNITDHELEDVTATVVYEDQDGKLVSSGHAIIGTLAAGETKTFITLDQHNSKMSKYDFEFEGRSNGERGGISFTTSKPKPKTARGRTRKVGR